VVLSTSKPSAASKQKRGRSRSALMLGTRRTTAAGATASFSSGPKRKSYSAHTSVGAGRPPDCALPTTGGGRPDQADSPQGASPPRDEPRRFGRGRPTSCLGTTEVFDRYAAVDLAPATAQIQASAAWARHDCFGSRCCSGLAMPLPIGHPGCCLDRRRERASLCLPPGCGEPFVDQPLSAVVRCRKRQQDVAPC
jgi:hypothetical protein